VAVRLTFMIPIGVLAGLSASAFAARVWQLPIGLHDSPRAPESFEHIVGDIAGDRVSVNARATPQAAAAGSDVAVAFQVAAASGVFTGGTGSTNPQGFDSAPLTLALGSIPAPMASHSPGSFGSSQATPTTSGTSDTNWTAIGPLHPGLGKTVGIDEGGSPRLVEVNPVPLPTPAVLAGFGLAALAGVRASARRRA